MTLDIFKEILTIFSTTAGTVMIAIVAALLIYGFKVICNRFGINISNDNMTEIIGIVTQVIKYLDQKFVDTIKKNSPTGSLTDHQKQIVKDKSIEMIIAMLDAKQIDFLLKKYKMEDINDVLDILIESTIKDTRMENNSETIIISNTTDTNNEDSKSEENIVNIPVSVYQATDEELTSIALCPSNCDVCPLTKECTICRK